jgi:hypothetical protein
MHVISAVSPRHNSAFFNIGSIFRMILLDIMRRSGAAPKPAAPRPLTSIAPTTPQIMAMKHPRGIVLAGALGALALMTALSAAAGTALPALLPRLYTHYASVGLFVIFGAKLLRDAAGMDSAGPSEELEVPRPTTHICTHARTHARTHSPPTHIALPSSRSWKARQLGPGDSRRPGLYPAAAKLHPAAAVGRECTQKPQNVWIDRNP